MPKAVILAAGRGTRMQDLTIGAPKPMLNAGGRPILERLLERLMEAGYSQALIVTGYRAESIEDYFRDYRFPLHFLRQSPIDGTATAALLARQFVGRDDFLLTFGDILADAPCYGAILDKLRREPGAEALLGVREVDDPYRGAAVYQDPDGRVTRIVEKPPQGQSTTRWNSAGIYAVRPSLFDELERVPKSSRGEYELTSAISQLIEKGKLLRIFPIEGRWRDIGRPEDLEAENGPSVA
jgi:UDP-N-acetylglucosamine diphosphorylase / glucose-1-phosphate thymidylyltransferase / UDP-N-acetylgalactosamine diphosphorylase / glucosamine-1-phosphate N-acetyltransferase / galactosamine-1-phosphate N-acetyltransferase